MSNKIFKYSIPTKEKYAIELPVNAKIIRVEDVDGLVFLWAIVDSSEGVETEKRYLEFYKTGQLVETPLDHLELIGTCKLFIMQELCLYVFENINPLKNEIRNIAKVAR